MFQSDLDKARKLQKQIFDGVKAAGITVEFPDHTKEVRYGYDVAFDKIKTSFKFERQGLYAAEGSPLKLVFGPADHYRKRLYIRESKKNGFDVAKVVERIRAYVNDEKELALKSQERKETEAFNKDLARKLNAKHGLTDRTPIKFSTPWNQETKGRISMMIHLDDINEKTGDKIALALKKAAPHLIVEKKPKEPALAKGALSTRKKK
jgi:hypothetical protein